LPNSAALVSPKLHHLWSLWWWRWL